MHRIIAIVVAGLALAACSSNSQWLNLDALKPGPTVEKVRFDSVPPGATVQVSTGQTCQTPCALAIPQPKSGAYAVTYTLNGYLPETEQLQLTSMGDDSQRLRPNPMAVQLTPVPPPPKVKKKVRRRRHVAKPARRRVVRPAKKRKTKPVVRRKPAPAQVQQQQAPSPWPPVQQPSR